MRDVLLSYKEDTLCHYNSDGVGIITSFQFFKYCRKFIQYTVRILALAPYCIQCVYWHWQHTVYSAYAGTSTIQYTVCI